MEGKDEFEVGELSLPTGGSDRPGAGTVETLTPSNNSECYEASSAVGR